MYKSIYLAQRNPALTEAQFHERWKEHSALTGTTQRIRPYFTQVVQCRRYDGAGPADATNAFDGANLLGLVERAGGYRVFEEPEHRDIMLPDKLLTFSGPIRDCTLIAREHVCLQGEMTRYLVLRFLRFAVGADREGQFARWCESQAKRDSTGPAAALVARSVANLVIEPAPIAVNFDVVTETWFREPPDVERHSQDDQAVRSLAEAIRALNVTDTLTFAAQVNHARPPIADRSRMRCDPISSDQPL